MASLIGSLPPEGPPPPPRALYSGVTRGRLASSRYDASHRLRAQERFWSQVVLGFLLMLLS